ncbi:hypothetical protein BJF83_21405 [Nocardiopsis sp. CNR-923]|nr:hypothetical protein BJF83_21405 [Nocardiopsis sp. CNR-923]
MRALIQSSRAADGHRVDAEAFFTALVVEATYDALVVDLDPATGVFLIRVLTTAGNDRSARHALDGARTYEEALAATPELVLPIYAVRAALWMGPDRGWVTFYDAD